MHIAAICIYTAISKHGPTNAYAHHRWRKLVNIKGGCAGYWYAYVSVEANAGP